MNRETLLHLATKLPVQSARRVVQALLAREGEAPAEPGSPGGSPSHESLAEVQRAAAAFADDMQPVVSALAAALHNDDLAALQGLRALLPGLLAEVNRAPALADLLAHQLGTAFLAGLKDDPQINADQRRFSDQA